MQLGAVGAKRFVVCLYVVRMKERKKEEIGKAGRDVIRASVRSRLIVPCPRCLCCRCHCPVVVVVSTGGRSLVQGCRDPSLRAICLFVG